MVDMNCNLIMNKTSKKEALDTFKRLKQQGIEKVVLTKYYMKSLSDNSNQTIKKIQQIIENILKENDVDIKVYFANISNVEFGLIEDYEAKKALTIAESKYVILDIGEEITHEKIDSIYEFYLKGYIPIIAHPERIINIKKEDRAIQELISYNCMFQLDNNSLKGVYGETVRRNAKYIDKKYGYKVIGSEGDIEFKLPVKVLNTFKETGMKILQS